MENNCPARPCDEVKTLRRDFEAYREHTSERLRAGDVSLATINTKLNWLIGILSALGAAMLTVVLKLVTGT